MADPKPKPLAEYGPFYGMRYAFDPTDNGENGTFVYEALNMVPADVVRGGAYLRRPGDNRSTVAASLLITQYLGVFQKRSGFLNVGIFSGELYTTPGGGASWTKQVTTANLTTAGITLSGTVACGAITYNNVFVINDGVNQPFTWDGTSGAGGLTLLSNAPTKCFGEPTVYYGKLVFIKDVAASNADRSTIVWSEENAANTGYEAGGYSNAWTLEQSGSGPIYNIKGTNEALYFFRAHGIGAIRGAMSATFSTEGVHDGIARYEGTTHPFGVAHTGTDLYFALTQTGEPCVITGGRVVHLGADIEDFIAETYLSSGLVLSAEARTVWVPFNNAVLFAIRSPTEGDNRLFLYSTLTRRCISRFTYEVAVYVVGSPMCGNSYDPTAKTFGLMVAAQSGGSTYTYQTPPGTNTLWYANGTPPSTFQLTLGPYQAVPGMMASVQKVEGYLDLPPKSGASATTITVAARQSNTKLVGGSTSDLGSVTLTPDSSARQEVRMLMGINEQWRNVQLTIRDSGTLRDYPWGVKRVLLYGEMTPLEPEST